MGYRLVVLMGIGLFSAGLIRASSSSAGQGLEDVSLFQSYFRDAPITSVPQGEVGIVYRDYDRYSDFNLDVQGRYPLNPRTEVGGGIGIISTDFEGNKGESGISDLMVVGRYCLEPGRTRISAGGYLTLPVGEEEVGQGHLNLGFFGALRHPLDRGMVLTGALGVDFLERGNRDDRETSLFLGGGVIYPRDDRLRLIGELTLQSDVDYMLLSGGADYRLGGGGKVRGALGVGLDDGAPDVTLSGSFLFSF